jgi:hypothetical protein
MTEETSDFVHLQRLPTVSSISISLNTTSSARQIA